MAVSSSQEVGRYAGGVAIVTGGADGFGASITRRFIRAGGSVVIIDLNSIKGEAMARENPDRTVFLRGDVTKRETWVEAAELGNEMFGGITTVVNNAGVSHDPVKVHEQPLELYDKIFNVNVRPIFLSVHVLAPIMLASGKSCSFVNISSTGYTRPRPGMAFYNASKAAVATATKTMALEYAPRIRFNAIAPAVGNTAILQFSIKSAPDPAAELAKLSASLPMGRITEPEDVANAALYLASEEAGFVTGTILEVDGGRGV